MKRNLHSAFEQVLRALVGVAVFSIFGPQAKPAQAAGASNDITSFVIGKSYLNLQNSTGAPVPNHT